MCRVGVGSGTWASSCADHPLPHWQVCWDGRCQGLDVYRSRNCSAKCHGHGVRWPAQAILPTGSPQSLSPRPAWGFQGRQEGQAPGGLEPESERSQVCNHKRECHCLAGWAPPYCAERLAPGPVGRHPWAWGGDEAPQGQPSPGYPHLLFPPPHHQGAGTSTVSQVSSLASQTCVLQPPVGSRSAAWWLWWSWQLCWSPWQLLSSTARLRVVAMGGGACPAHALPPHTGSPGPLRASGCGWGTLMVLSLPRSPASKASMGMPNPLFRLGGEALAPTPHLPASPNLPSRLPSPSSSTGTPAKTTISYEVKGAQ